MPPDYSFIANPQTSSGLQSLSSIMNTAATAQGIQATRQNIERGAVALKKERALLQPEIARGQALSQEAQTSAQRANWALNADQATAGKQILGGLLSDAAIQKGDSEGSVFALMKAEDLAKAAGLPEATIKAHMAPLYMAAAHAPEQLFPMIKQITSSNIAPAQQIQNTFPAPIQQDIGEVITPLAAGNASLTGVPVGTQQGIATVKGLLPTTQRYNPQTQQMEFVGQAQTPGVPSGPVLAGAPLGVEASMQNVAAANKADWEPTFLAAAKAEQNAGIMNNLKIFADKAVVGQEAELRQRVTGIRALFASDDKTENLWQKIISAKTADDAKTATDLFIKNSNMPALNGGTDALRNLIMSANPNVHMNINAIKESSDQVRAQFLLQPLRAKYLAPYLGDPLAYAKAANTFNDYADPRVLQYPDMTDEQRSKMASSMNKREQEAFGTKIRFFQNQGWLK